MREYYGLLVSRLTGWLEAFVSSLPNLVAAALIAVGFGLLARLAARLTRRAAERLNAAEAVVSLATTVAKCLVLAAGVFVALGVLGLQKTVVSLLAGAGILGLALAFAFQDIAANFVAGVLMGFRKPFVVGHVVETNDFMGTVREVNLRNTVIDTFSGQRVIVPNKDVFENPLVNYHSTGLRRVELAVGVAYDSDLEQVARVAHDAMEGLDFLADGKDVEVYAQSFGGSSIDFSLRYWIDSPGDVGYPSAVHAGVLAVKRAFDENGIEIPFPIRTLDFSLSEGAPMVGRVEGLDESHASHGERGDAEGELRTRSL